MVYPMRSAQLQRGPRAPSSPQHAVFGPASPPAVRLTGRLNARIDERRQIAEFALRHRLPSVHAIREYVEAGGLMSYGANTPEMFRLMADQVAQMLDGARPGDVPLTQVTRFELVINLKTAKALGLTIPRSLLLRADQVIE
jgi:ABC-type uncharacterized transport system substrate-binding protein